MPLLQRALIIQKRSLRRHPIYFINTTFENDKLYRDLTRQSAFVLRTLRELSFEKSRKTKKFFTNFVSPMSGAVGFK